MKCPYNGREIGSSICKNCAIGDYCLEKPAISVAEAAVKILEK